MASLVKETSEGQTTQALTVSREPVGPKKAGSKGSMGDVALMDAIILVGLAWVLLWIIGFSLRSHNV